MIRLSVIIPVYNVEDYVAKCLDSLIPPAEEAILRGEEPEYEIIAVNDGSTDSSPAIVQDYVNHYPQFIRLITTENMGQGHARNVGIDEAQGEYLYFIDSDDYLAPGAMGEMLRTLDGSYDFIFVDAAKAQYIHYFPELMRLLEQDGYLVSDNVLQDGDLIQSRFAVERRNRTIHARMREYLYELTHNQELTTSILPVGDGVAVSVKDRKEEQL